MRWFTGLALSTCVLFGACALLSGEPASGKLGSGKPAMTAPEMSRGGSASEPTGAGQTPALAERFTLQPGEAALVGSERVRLLFDRVVNDSRCPRDVRCVRAGDATVRVQVTLAGASTSTIDLRTTPADEHVTVGDYTLTLADLAPVPLSGEPVKATEYRATFVLVRAR
jgi:hypothetical protein